MTARRLFSVEPLERTGAIVRLDPREGHHGHDVLRLRPGDQVAVFDALGHQYSATVERFEKKRLTIALGDLLPGAPEPPVAVHLYLALAKPRAFDAVLERAVELGAAEIVPFAAERSVPALARSDALERKIERWRQILLSATKQCGRVRLTAIAHPLPFDDAVRRPGSRAIRLCAVPDPTAPRLGGFLKSLQLEADRPVAIMIGPEGGLTDSEIDSARRSGWQPVSLGSRTLRVETAATAALALILAAAGDI